jgi:hypothetical protein
LPQQPFIPKSTAIDMHTLAEQSKARTSPFPRFNCRPTVKNRPVSLYLGQSAERRHPAMTGRLSAMTRRPRVHPIPTNELRAALRNLKSNQRSLKNDVARIKQMEEYRLDDYASRNIELVMFVNAMDAAIILTAPSFIEKFPPHAYHALNETVASSLEFAFSADIERPATTGAN